MEIRDMTSSTFWKGESGVRAIVLDIDRKYKVSLDIKGSQVYDYSCLPLSENGKSCPACAGTGSGRGLCVHAKALWEHYQAQMKLHSGRPVSTSQEVRTMIREYTNREVARIIQDNEEHGIRMVPRLLLRDGGVCLEFRLGRDRLYILKDLLSFTRAMETGALVNYGKQLEFHHSIHSFVREDRGLVSFVMELANIFEDHYRQLQKSSFATMQSLRDLHLSRANVDRFFRMMSGRSLEIEDERSGCYTVEVKENLMQIDLKIRKFGRDGISVSVPQDLYGFLGEEHLYVGNRKELYCLDAKATDALGIFMIQILSRRGERQIELQDRDVPLFLERVLQKILPYCRIDAENVDLAKYRPQELKARFSFDSPAAGEITMIPELSYGDYTFVPMEDEKVPRTICRDVPGEFRISQVITKYFRFREADMRTLVIKDDDDAVYRLLKDGIAEFMDLGEVYISEKASRMKMIRPEKVEIGVHASGNWLELKIDAQGLDRDELVKILADYDRKKPYYRLKNGKYLQMDDDGMMTVARMIQGLGLSRQQLSEEVIRVPRYRALYLDSILKEDNGLSFYRDNIYKAMIRGMKSIEDSDYRLPASMEHVLRLYQRMGFRWMRTLDNYGFGGILADEMGIGKTIQVIALLLDEKERCQTRMSYLSGTKEGRDESAPPVSLIVCPASLVYNWENEIHRFAPQLSVQSVTGSAAEREAVLSVLLPWKADSRLPSGSPAAACPDVLITSYDLLKRDVALYREIPFRFQVIDEAQFIKNPATQSARAVKQVQAKTRFALTGTPVENRLSELWSIFDYLMPGFLFTWQKFKQAFETPIMKDGDEQALERLHRFIGPFVLRRLKKEVLKDLPEKLETVFYSRASGTQRDLYTASALMLKEQLEAMDSGSISGERIQILAELMRLRQICCDPSLCFPDYKGGSAKLETLMALLASAIEGGHKILVFSQFASMLDIIAGRLKKEHIAFHLLTGATSKEERIHMAGAFQDDDVPVFLISLKAGGTGLNLTAADIVVHYDPWWNVAAQNQATDRTHRIGQEKQVTVFQLIMKDTIEENIRTLQEQKQALAEQVITEGTVSLSSLTKDELIQILGV